MIAWCLKGILSAKKLDKAENGVWADFAIGARKMKKCFWAKVSPMGGMMIHTLTLARAKVKIAFKNLAYNIARFAFLVSKSQRALA